MSLFVPLLVEFSLFSFNNGMVVSSCRELDNNRSALSAASAFAIATAGANEGTPTKEKYRRMSLASTGQSHDAGVPLLVKNYKCCNESSLHLHLHIITHIGNIVSIAYCT